MSKLKQCIYTVILLITCLVASPFIYKQIWNKSELKEEKTHAKEPVAVTQPAETTTADSQGTETATQPASEGGTAPTEQTTEPAAPQTAFIQSGPEYFDDALFIGDSRTVGLSSYGTLKNAEYFCDIGLSVLGIDEKKVGSVTVWEQLKKKKYGKIYIMLGINEIGNDIAGTTAKYRRLVDGIRTEQPDALIFLQANLHVAPSAETSLISNARIDELNTNLEGMADNSHIYYINVNGIFDDGNGALTADYTSDGIHVLAKYYATWCDWLCQNTIEVKAQPKETKTAETSSTEAASESKTTTENKKPQNEEFSNM